MNRICRGLLRPSGEPLLSSEGCTSWMRNSQIGGMGFCETRQRIYIYIYHDRDKKRIKGRKAIGCIYHGLSRINNTRESTRLSKIRISGGRIKIRLPRVSSEIQAGLLSKIDNEKRAMGEEMAGRMRTIRSTSANGTSSISI